MTITRLDVRTGQKTLLQEDAPVFDGLEQEQAAIQQERDQILATARSVAAVLGISVPADAEQRAETEALKRRPR